MGETRSFNTGVYVVREQRGDGVGVMVLGEYVLYMMWRFNVDLQPYCIKETLHSYIIEIFC